MFFSFSRIITKNERGVGYHAFFIAKVPFIPILTASDFTQSFPYKGKSRLEIITERQVRFIHDIQSLSGYFSQ